MQKADVSVSIGSTNVNKVFHKELAEQNFDGFVLEEVTEQAEFGSTVIIGYCWQMNLGSLSGAFCESYK